MVKKIILIISLALSLFSIARADVLSKSQIDFNEQVMSIMKDIENKAIDQKNIDQYLSHVKASNEVKQVVMSNIEHHINYSSYHKLGEGLYLCNGGKKAISGSWNSVCMMGSCVFNPGSTCGWPC